MVLCMSSCHCRVNEKSDSSSPAIINAQLHGLEQPTHADSNGALPAVNTRECTRLRSVFKLNIILYQ